MTQPIETNRALAGAIAEGFAQAFQAPVVQLVAALSANGQNLGGIEAALLRIAGAVEAIQDRLTPEEERVKVYQVAGYVRSANNGGDLVYLYAAHPGLNFKVATVYSENFPHLRPFLNPAQGKPYDGDVAPTREGAGKKGYLQECIPFEIVLRPTAKRTDAGLMTYDFEAARAMTAAPTVSTQPPIPLPAAPRPERAAAPVTSAPASQTGQPAAAQPPAARPPAPDQPAPEEPAWLDDGLTSDQQFDAMRSASAARQQAAVPPAAQPPARYDQPTGIRPATIGAGDTYRVFGQWAVRFAARYPYYAQGERPNYPKLLESIAGIGRKTGQDFGHITLENLAAIQNAMEQHAAANHAQGK